MTVNRDPNHYTKGLAKHVTNLCHEHPALNIVMASIKKFKKNELGFTTHMKAFIPHITDQHHHWCSHSTQPPKPPKVDANEHPEVIKKLKDLIKGYINDCQCYMHGFSTIQNKSLNGTAAKHVDKQHQWTIMYGALFDASIIKRNNSSLFFYH
ncbi:uncharacterized protein ACA1_373400 [Acanthamoeba castellanii str. Neff]|uniref:Uncharacterized protein n=1 Tax=Acanthamoeba castellanii (strain ATCC 30010 / Neff) TaxID=1257118 RepID=L8GHG1_ACACF|nr:uncharacterized protein ACA1_373400 [Acanthamoeba castellanii str. Neff]ELR12289.1 hypothetical protein ACA1_373400 [Acanthamoeba castellanii str. Neff]